MADTLRFRRIVNGRGVVEPLEAEESAVGREIAMRRTKRAGAVPWLMLLSLLPLSGVSLEAGAPRSPTGLSEYIFTAHLLLQIGDLIQGETVTDLRNPLVPVRCDGRLERVWNFTEYAGEPEPILTRCELGAPSRRPSATPRSRAWGSTWISRIGSHQPDFYWDSLDAASGETCDGGGAAAAILGELNSPGDLFGVVADPDGAHTVFVEEGDLIPDGGGATFIALGAVATAGNYVAFSGSGAGGVGGVYVYDRTLGTLTRIVDSTMPRPRSPGNFTGASSTDLFEVGGEMWVAWADGAGAYTAPVDLSAPPTQPAAVGDPYAAGRNLHGPLNQVSYWEPGRLVFRGVSETLQDGIYSVALASPGVIVRHADNETTTLAEGTGSFGALQSPSGAGDTLLFEAFSSSFVYLGAFADRDLADGPVTPFLLRNDPLDGKTVQTVVVNKRSVVRGGEVAALVYFTNATGGVYLFTRSALDRRFRGG